MVMVQDLERLGEGDLEYGFGYFLSVIYAWVTLYSRYTNFMTYKPMHLWMWDVTLWVRVSLGSYFGGGVIRATLMGTGFMVNI